MVLALPMAKVLKDHFPGIKICFLGREYTRPVVNACSYVDGFIERNDFLRNKMKIDGEIIQAIVYVKPDVPVARRGMQLRIRWRIGTTNRGFHWVTCNKLVTLSRKRSDLHEAQLNLKLLKPLGIEKIFSLEEISESYGLNNLEPLCQEFLSLIDKTKYNLILHPKSRGSAREWGLSNFISLVKQLDPAKYKIFISGTAEEKKLLQPLLDETSELVTDITGRMKLAQFISFISACDGLIACSTGPLHLASALGKEALGIYVPIRPMHAGRWGPVGKKSEVFVAQRTCSDCAEDAKSCHCITEVDPAWIKASLERRAKTKLENANKSF